MSKPIILHGKGQSPNPPKIAIMLEELGVPYEVRPLEFADLKKEPYTNLNPNGRMPTIEDPETGLILWETGAIIEYLFDKFDKEHKFSYSTEAEKYKTKQWLFFQVSGQGPYFGQLAWFKFYHHEKNITSAIERYEKEVERVSGVIDAHLKKQGTKYLVGDKVTYADLAFITWYGAAFHGFYPNWDYKKQLPTFAAWIDELSARPSVAKVMAMDVFKG